MKTKYLAIVATILFQTLDIFATNSFCLQSEQKNITQIKINEYFTESKTVYPFPISKEIIGFGISGNIDIKNEDFLVRVILKDEEDNDYLVLELFDMIKSDDYLSFENYCEETILLNNIRPKELCIILTNANLTIKEISFLDSSKDRFQSSISYNNDFYRLRNSQVDDIIRRINSYNSNHQKLWLAGKTPISLKRYKEKQKMMGLKDTDFPDGFEYYISGIFEAGHLNENSSHREDSLYIDHFDWRNRHGKNWMNSVKNQMGSGYCLAFASAGTIEARMNLYYNRKLGLDFSAQNIATCAQRAGTNSYYDGLWYEDVLPFLVSNGVCDDYSYPFENNPSATCNIDNINYRELVKIDSYTEIGHNNADSIKKTIIHDGPLLSGYAGHSMVLVGYGVIHAGDSIRISNGNAPGNHICIPSGSQYIGKTYWIFKNSYGNQSGITTDGGYAYIIFNNMNIMKGPYRLNYPFTIQPPFNHTVICEDADGDGYYTWGLGTTRPYYCPYWAPYDQDGDDSNPDYGPIDQYGNLTLIDYTSQSTITGSTLYNNNATISTNTVVMPGAVMTITSTVTLDSNVRLTIRPSGTLIINGGTLENADLLLNSGCHVIINNGGKIIMRSGRIFNSSIGSDIDISNGSIQ